MVAPRGSTPRAGQRSSCGRGIAALIQRRGETRAASTREAGVAWRLTGDNHLSTIAQHGANRLLAARGRREAALVAAASRPWAESHVERNMADTQQGSCDRAPKASEAPTHTPRHRWPHCGAEGVRNVPATWRPRWNSEATTTMLPATWATDALLWSTAAGKR